MPGISKAGKARTIRRFMDKRKPSVLTRLAFDPMGNNVSEAARPAKRGLISVAEARAIMLGAVGPLESENVDLEAGLGRVLAGDVIAVRDQPPFDVSSM